MRLSPFCLWFLILLLDLIVHCGDVNAAKIGSSQKSSGPQKVVAASARVYPIDSSSGEAFEGHFGPTSLTRYTVPQGPRHRDGSFLDWTVEVCHLPQDKWEESSILRQVWRHLGKWCPACSAETGVNGVHRPKLDISPLAGLEKVFAVQSRLSQFHAQFSIQPSGTACSFRQKQAEAESPTWSAESVSRSLQREKRQWQGRWREGPAGATSARDALMAYSGQCLLSCFGCTAGIDFNDCSQCELAAGCGKPYVG